MQRTLAIVGVVLGLMAGSAQAAFFGRDASNQAAACSVSGSNKCVSFYNDILDITILNNWNIGAGAAWDGSASPSATSAQGLAAAAGLAATGLSGWVLPTGDGNQAAGPLNQYLSIMLAVGYVPPVLPTITSPFANLSAQFDGVQQFGFYWSSTQYSDPNQPNNVWRLDLSTGWQNVVDKSSQHLAVAVRSGDVASPVPIPATVALLGLGIVGIGAARRKRA
jgi:hypothetical protein